jgi:D-glycero-alpha-D-manno-heptose-7-phosphate kinase
VKERIRIPKPRCAKKDRSVQSVAPTRIDLAGGTIDIWPLYLFHDRALTVNVAIDLFASVRVEKRKGSRIKIISRDQKVSFDTDASFSNLEKTSLEFLARIAKFYQPKGGLTITSECESPAGAGLGGSSALGIAMSFALNTFFGRRFTNMYQLHAIKNIETRILGVPTGEQDYYSALLGGLNAISYGVAGTKVKRLPSDLKRLQSRLVLCYTGKERQSGLSNWDMVKRHIDGQARVRKAMEGICSAADSMMHALQKNDFDTAGEILNKEWQNRKKLSPKVSSRKIERLIREASTAGAIGGKVCGAGGGGCLIFITEEGKRNKVERILRKEGGKILKFHICSEGVRIY